MPLDVTTLEKVEAWLAKNCPDLSCPICKSTTWEPAEIGILMPFRDGRVIRAPIAYPFLPLFCKQCGYTYFFSAVLMGLMSSDSPPPSS